MVPGRILSRAAPGGASIGYEYNDRGMLSKRTGLVPKQDGQDVYEDTFAYDALGRMTVASRNLNGQEQSRIDLAYDSLGRLLSESLTIGGVTKTVAYPSYDQADRRRQMVLPEEDVAFTYDYDAAGRVQTVGRVKPDANDVIATYAYDGPAVAKRRVTVRQNPNLYVDWDVGRDGLPRLTSSTSTRVPDDPNHARIFASFIYERGLMGDPNSETFTWSGDPNEAAATQRFFTYDALHRLTQVTYGTNPSTSPKEIFNMDLAGNRITYHARDGSDANYISNIANQYTHISPPDADLTYDPAGNLTQDQRGYQFTYDHDNKLIKVLGPNMPAVTFDYDALGRRVSKIDWGTSTARYYVSSGQNELAEYDGTGTRLRYYVHGPTYIDERVVMHDDATNKDYVYLLKDLYTVAGLADDRGWPVEYYDYDAYGTVHMYRCAMLPFAADLDGDGAVDNEDLAIFKQCYRGSGNEPNTYGGLGWMADLDGDGDVDGSDYVSFAHCWNGPGNEPRCPMPDAPSPILSLGSMATSRTGNPYFFTGRHLDILNVHDANTPHHLTDDYGGLTLYDYRRRTLDPAQGRFLQVDPVPHLDGPNPYEGIRSSPIRWVDPRGTEAQGWLPFIGVVDLSEVIASAKNRKPLLMGHTSAEFDWLPGQLTIEADSKQCACGNGNKQTLFLVTCSQFWKLSLQFLESGIYAVQTTEPERGKFGDALRDVINKIYDALSKHERGHQNIYRNTLHDFTSYGAGVSCGSAGEATKMCINVSNTMAAGIKAAMTAAVFAADFAYDVQDTAATSEYIRGLLDGIGALR
jgi:RHS repeat-associated protein